MQIRLAKVEELQRVLDILNEVTLDLKQKGINQWIEPWDENKVLDQINNHYIYVLLNSEETITGTFCLYDIDRIKEVSVGEISKYLSQIAILPKYQGRNYGSKITQFACSLVKEMNQTLYLDCWAGNDKLKEFYSNNGFEYIGDFPEEDYLISMFKYN
ncbi:GNAT family N-acetyltransferase [Alkalihalobacterium alkalinitrilicum]|uniref:GNAT family N-acetyltransferase n=1 Tax=Alkalihalobacterium alkalinitrilicum TaxID=427920 RepID=UPI0009948F98|nr:GNAT family N-acetyltransferase [Alkalihalobacterium alkalinitrilicum]